MDKSKRVTYKDIPKQNLVDEYINTEKSVEQARHIWGLTHKTFVKALKYHGLVVKGRQSKYEQLRDKEWLKEQYYDFKKSCKQIAEEIGSTPGAVNSALRCIDIEFRTSNAGLKLRYPHGRFGKNAANWRGGKRKYGQGYVGIRKPEHPHANKEGYVMEHRLVLEKKLGRYLEPHEIAHHVNGIKNDNRPENIELEIRGQHTQNHFKDSFKTKELLEEVNRLINIINNCENCKSQLETK